MSMKKDQVTFLENLTIFEDFLSTLTLDTPTNKNGWSSFEIKPVPATETSGRAIIQPVWVIWYKECHSLNITSIRKKITHLLEANNHLANDEICDVFIAGFLMFSDIGNSAVDRFNILLDRIVEAELSQFLIFKHELPIKDNTTFGDFSIGNFTIGLFPKELVESRCSRAGSDFALRYKECFKQYTFSIYCEPKKCKVINWRDLAKGKDLDFVKTKKIYSLIDHYHFVMSQQYFELFFKELAALQEIPQAFGSGWFNVDVMKQYFNSERLSIWLDIGGKKIGWVSPGTFGQVVIDLGGFHIGMPYIYNELKKQFGEWEKQTELYNVIKVYCSYLAKARVSECMGNTSESLLNYVIALDFLLGEKGSSVDSFSTRCSALTYLVLGRAYKDLVRECKQVYDARSKFVHQGNPPEQSSVDKIFLVSREVALCLFRLNKNAWGNDTGFHKKWIAYTDILVAKINAEQQPSLDDYANAGVAQRDEYCYLNILNGLSSKTTD